MSKEQQKEQQQDAENPFFRFAFLVDKNIVMLDKLVTFTAVFTGQHSISSVYFCVGHM
jgi:hypothetical protein